MLAKLVTECDSKGTKLYKAVWVYCPGCEDLHRFIVERFDDKTEPVWDWNDNLETPSFSPSYLAAWHDGKIYKDQYCHSFLRDGVWDFLSDSTHKLANQKAPMVDLPEWFTKA